MIRRSAHQAQRAYQQRSQQELLDLEWCAATAVCSPLLASTAVRIDPIAKSGLEAHDQRRSAAAAPTHHLEAYAAQAARLQGPAACCPVAAVHQRPGAECIHRRRPRRHESESAILTLRHNTSILRAWTDEQASCVRGVSTSPFGRCGMQFCVQASLAPCVSAGSRADAQWMSPGAYRSQSADRVLPGIAGSGLERVGAAAEQSPAIVPSEELSGACRMRVADREGASVPGLCMRIPNAYPPLAGSSACA